jgi:antitoxin component of MazEF toxin-antitoxin module
MKIDLREFSDDELSLYVMNDESFYRMRRNRRALVDLLDSVFLYTDCQLETLNQDLDDEEKESESC